MAESENVTRNKARLVAQSYAQIKRIDFEKTFGHALLPKIRGNEVAMRVGDIYTREKYSIMGVNFLITWAVIDPVMRAVITRTRALGLAFFH